MPVYRSDMACSRADRITVVCRLPTGATYDPVAPKRQVTSRHTPYAPAETQCRAAAGFPKVQLQRKG